jgi:hypothetical protein
MRCAVAANLVHGDDGKPDQPAGLRLAPITQTDAASMLDMSPRTVASGSIR